MYEPLPGSKGYKRVLDRGCGGTKDYYGEFDCCHNYPWYCEDCPINTDRYYHTWEYWVLSQLEDATDRGEAIAIGIDELWFCDVIRIMYRGWIYEIL